jgi:phosphoribosylpyrophosphate synthetase
LRPIVFHLTSRTVVLACSLARPDEKTLPLLFAADAARDLGAAKVLLAAPCLAYLRQDRRFHAGEAVTSRSYAALLSRAFDALVTADPHLHRDRSWWRDRQRQPDRRRGRRQASATSALTTPG